MDIYRIPRHEIPVQILLDDARTVDGTFFTHGNNVGGRPQDVLERLNESNDEFVPLTCGRDSFLLNKAGIIWVQLRGGPAREIEGESGAARHVPVRLTLAGGLSVMGMLAIVMPPERSRVLDYMNAAGRFFPLFGEGTVTLVHRRFVVTVRNGEDAEQRL